MNASSSSPPSYDDLSTLYEAALQNYRNLDKQVPKENRNTKEYAHRSLSARVELLRAVQCAALLTSHRDYVDDDDDDDKGVKAAQALLTQTTLDVDQDALEQVRAMETLLPQQQLIMMMDDSKAPRLPLQTMDVDVNAFFEAYPECAKKNLKDEEESSSSSSSSSESSEDSDEEDERYRQRKERKQTKRQRHAAAGTALNNSGSTEQLTSFQPPPATSYKNPYAKKVEQQQQQPQQQQSRAEIDLTQDGQFPYSAGSTDYNSSSGLQQQQQQQQNQQVPLPYQQQQQQQQQPWGDHSRGQQPYQHQRWHQQQSYQQQQQQQHHQSWEDHNRGQNPFQTAREYAWAGEPLNNTNNNTETQQQQQHAPRGAYHNPYQQQQSVERPVIRESLKRKFQPPNKRTSADNGEKPARGNATTTTAANPPRKLGLAGGARGHATATQNHNNTKQKSSKDDNSNSNDDDDDLPEELKRFGKELVEKIESEIMDYGDPVTFQDIAGLDDAKQTVQEVVCWPMKRPDLFTGLRRAPNGLLLYGPPGTGKTLIGKAIAHESGATFFSISSSSLTSKWIGEGEKLVRVMFAVAAVRQPAVVFIDEIDSLLTQRKSDENEASRRIKTEFLVQLDGTGTSGQGRVLVIGATNRPQELDEAARRRFTKRLYIPLPEESDREILLRVLLEKNNHRLVDDEIKKLAKDTEGYSGADLKALSTDAAMGPIRELGAKALDVDVQDVPPITYKHFRRALRGMKPSVAPSDLDQYIEWDKTYGTKRAEQDCDGDNDDDMSEGSREN